MSMTPAENIMGSEGRKRKKNNDDKCEEKGGKTCIGKREKRGKEN